MKFDLVRGSSLIAFVSFFIYCLSFSPSKSEEIGSLGSCGLINRNESGFRIVGGARAKPGEFPWQASVRDGEEHHCGGTLIHPKWVLSAGHCYHYEQEPADGWQVSLGDINFQRTEGTEQLITVKRVIIHPSFNDPEYANDIALLELESEADITPSVNHACLPLSQDVFDGNYCTVTGFGATENEDFSKVLMKLRKPVVKLRQCQYYHCKFGAPIYDTNLCAGITTGGRDTCRGDSGGPLVCPSKDKSGLLRWVLAGLVSYGEECGLEEAPGVYTQVSKYVDWIQHVTNIKFPYGVPLTEEEREMNPFINTAVTVPYKCGEF